MLIFASNKFCVCGTRMYAILFYRYDLSIYGGSRGQRETFVGVTSRSLAFHLSHLVFALIARLL